MKNILYLASQSSSRQELLRQAHISFIAIEHAAEEYCDENRSFEQLVLDLALLKMEHACVPDPATCDLETDKPIFVLTADTLTCDMRGNIFGKPRDREHAVEMIKALRSGSRVATGFCIDKKRLVGAKWEVEDRISATVSAECICDVPDHWIDRYLENTPALHASGSLILDDYGAMFVKKITGSYSTIIGLPMSEVREALEKLGFFE